MRDLVAAVWQFEARPGDVEANLASFDKALTAAGDVDLFVAPEMFPTGWYVEDATWATEAGSDLERRIGAAARDHATWVATSLHRREGKARRNTFTLWDDRGRVVRRQDKIHLWAEEAEHLEPGDDVATTGAPFARLGGMVCYDVEFPEVSRALALQGAEVLALPAAFFTHQTWDLMTRTRALENGCFLVAANSVGGVGPKPQCGDARIVDPSGTLLAQTKGKKSVVAVATLEASRLTSAREWAPYLKQRRRAFA